LANLAHLAVENSFQNITNLMLTCLDSLALSCQGCNGSKSIKIESFDAISQSTAKFYNPRKDV
jgi:hypothetical protein